MDRVVTAWRLTPRRRMWAAALGGVLGGSLYGFVMDGASRLGWLPFDFVSVAGIFSLPLVMGAICVALSAPAQQARMKYWFLAPWLTVALTYAVLTAVQWEALICLIMLLPATLALSSLGGVLAGLLVTWLRRRRHAQRGIVGCFIVLPLLLGQFELHMETPVELHTVQDRIVVEASPEHVWATLLNVPDIRDTELQWSFSHAIGLPKPRAALLNGSGVGSVRDLYWDDGVHFREHVTAWEPGQRLAYDVDVTPAREALRRLDTHVVIGDRYFDVLRGEYQLRELAPGRTELTLSTTYRISTNVNAYGNLWARHTLDDFHTVVLGLLKHRAEHLM
ncbi:SRPBCC family protein [Dyella tabacisoli]|uniref:SRPBCC family protein n=1 Tax=Dyella tabacisoli TaxID=2282381 RepID=A0A369UU60_9GAMM|nr:SRPBCC family protein [Dyella tabacisoli]RDD83258.1 hypothetical protein DVJ77_01255 [Dyella tabacisoli]